MAGLYSHTTRASGLVLTANIYNSDHQNHITNLSIDMLGITYTDAAYDATTDGQSGGSRSKPTSLQGQLERLAFAVKQIKVLLSPAITNWWETISSLTGNGSGLTGIVTSDSVTNITGDTTITSAQMTGRVKFYNSAQAAITLPAATAGLTAVFEIVNSGGIRFIRNGSDTFICGGAASLTALPVGGTTYDIVVGGEYELTCYVAGTWTVKRRGIQPAIEVIKNADQTGIVDNTLTLVSWQTETKDNNAEFASNTLSPCIPGEYTFDVGLCISAQTDGEKIHIVLYKNGTWLNAMMFTVGANAYVSPAAHFKEWNDGNDTFKIYVDLQGGGGTIYYLEPVQGVNGSYFKASRTPD